MRKSCLVIIAVSLLIQIGSAKEKYELKLKWEKGMKITRNTNSTFDLNQKVSGSTEMGDKTQKIPEREMAINTEVKQETVDKIIEINENNILNKVKREVIAYKQKTEMDPPLPKGIDTPDIDLTGTIFVITSEDGEIDVEVKEGDKFAESIANSQVALDEEYAIYFPKDKVKVKDEWEVDIKKMKKAVIRGLNLPIAKDKLKISDFSGSMKCKLKDVVEENKQKIAVIVISSDIELNLEMKTEKEVQEKQFKMSGDIEMKMKSLSELKFNITKGELVSYTSDGKIKQNIEMETDFGMGVSVSKITGEGEVEISEKFSYEKK